MQLTIEKLIYGGDGLARLPADMNGRGKAAFVPFTLPGEKVDVAIKEDKPGFVRAEASQILQASPQRIEAGCPYFRKCGGCHYQHANYSHQLEIKTEVLRESLRRLAKIELDSEIKVHASPPWNYRNRTRLQVRAGSEFTLGYFERSSHALLAVETCPISSPLLNRAIALLWQFGRAGQVPPELREIELFANADDAQLQVELYGSGESAHGNTHSLRAFAERLRAELAEIVSIYVFAQILATARGSQGHITEERNGTLAPGEFFYRTKTASLRVSGGSFFQVNRFLLDELVSIVTGGRSGELALDLYAGVGLFTGALARSFGHIVAVESSQSSVGDLKYNSPPNGKAVRSTVEEYLDGKGGKLRPDMVVVDPPRAGLGERVARSLARLEARRLTYVSCDPATLARDLTILAAGGYRVEQAHLVDLFPQTYHLESVLEMVR